MSEQRVATLSLPYPPSCNLAVRHSRGGHYLPREIVRYRAAVLELWQRCGAAPFVGPIWVSVAYQPRMLKTGKPPVRRLDLDNVFKAALDALQSAGAFQSDKQVTRLTAELVEPIVAGGLLVILETDDRPVVAKLACIPGWAGASIRAHGHRGSPPTESFPAA